jgi:hypothetical protein
MSMAHPLVLALFSDAERAAAGVAAVRALGVRAEQLSVVARNHEEQGEIAERIGATPGAEIEDSRLAARLGELSGHVLAAIALVLPGIGPIVASGPLSAGLGEAAGHVAGDLSAILGGAGVSPDRADRLERDVHAGAVLIGAHVISEGTGEAGADAASEPGGAGTGQHAARVTAICQAFERHGGREVTVAEWKD